MSKLIQYSTSWCGPCRFARKRLSEILDKDDYIYVELDTGLIVTNDEDQEKASQGILGVLQEIGQPRSVPSFAIVDKDYEFISKPKDINEAISLMSKDK